MGEVVQFRREPWQRRVCKMTGMECMATVECCCICKHETRYRQAAVSMYGDFWDQRHSLIEFAKAGAPPELS